MHTNGLITDSIREDSVGSGTYAKGLVNALLKYDKENKYYLIDYKKTDFNKKNIIFISNPFFKLKTYLWHLFLPFRVWKFKLDLIINLTSGSFLFSLGQKIIPVIYDLTLDLFPDTHPKNRVLFNNFFLKNTLDKSYKIIVPSKSTKKDLIKYYSIPENKIIVLFIPVEYKPVNVSKVGKKVKFSFPYILNVNTVEPRKNISSLIKAFNKLKKENKILHKLIICGGLGWKYEPIFDQVKSLKLEEDVIFLGYVTEEEKKYLYTKADVFVYPSFYEGFGIPILEAQIYKCPVITSNVSSMPETAGRGALLVNPYSIVEISDAIYKVLYNKKIKEKLIREGNKQSQKYTSLDYKRKQVKRLIKFIYE